MRRKAEDVMEPLADCERFSNLMVRHCRAVALPTIAGHPSLVTSDATAITLDSNPEYQA